MREFAVRVLATDIRLHGRRFVTVEFEAAVGVAAALALVVGITAMVRGTGEVTSVVGVVFFAGVAVNSAAVVHWVGRQARELTPQKASLVDLALFCYATLLPGALALALRPPG